MADGVAMSDEQVELLLDAADTAWSQVEALLEMMHTYAAAGGRDPETYERLCDHWARAGLRMVMTGRGVTEPGSAERAATALAPVGSDRGVGVKAQVHRTLAPALLVAVWNAGEHFLVDEDSWPPELPGLVWEAVRRSPRINDDPLLQG